MSTSLIIRCVAIIQDAKVHRGFAVFSQREPLSGKAPAHQLPDGSGPAGHVGFKPPVFDGLKLRLIKHDL